MANRLLEGLRLEKWSERLRVRKSQGDTPPVRWGIDLHGLVSDQSQLSPDFPGRMAGFGGGFFPTAGNHLAVAVVAGRFGCRVMLDLQITAAATASLNWIIVPATSSLLPLAGTLSGGGGAVPRSLYNAYNPQEAMDCGSQVFIGGITPAQLAASFPGEDVPTYLVRDATVAANAQWHVGGGQVNEPKLALRPGRALIMVSRIVNTFGYFSGYLRENGDEPAP